MRSPIRTAVYRVYRSLHPVLRTRLVRWLTPNYTLGAVVLLTNEKDELLLVRQQDVSQWSLPGGLLDRREHPVDGARRELAEEVNVTLGRSELTPASPNAVVNPRTQQVDMAFRATVHCADIDIRVDGDELAEAAWYPLAALPAVTTATVRLLGSYGIGTR